MGRGPRSGWRGDVAGFDRLVDRAFDRLRGRPAADAVFYAASAVGDHGLLWLTLGAVRAVREGNAREARRVAVVMGLESAVVNLGIKSLFRRVRPVSGATHPFRLRVPRTSSFPSGHATSAFCAAAVLSEGDPAAPLYYALATVVAASRVHVRIHHASDVVAGVLIGAALGRVARRIWPRRESPPGAPVLRSV